MKAAVVAEHEEPSEYSDATPKPSPKANEILIKVKAASLNRADLAVASGHRHGTVGGAGTIVGLECAGEVEAVGADVKDFKPGDRVMSSAAGGFAEYAVTDSGRAHKIPANNMSYEQAACMPVAVQTMHNALVGAGRLKKGEIGADPGRLVRRRPARHADRQAHGRLDRHGQLDQRGPPRQAQGLRLRRRDRHDRSPSGRRRSRRRPAARAST